MLHLSSEAIFRAAPKAPALVSTTVSRIQRHKALGRKLSSLSDRDIAGIARLRRQRDQVLRSFKTDPPQAPSDAAVLIRYVLTLCHGFDLTIAERDCLKAVAKSLADLPAMEAS